MHPSAPHAVGVLLRVPGQTSRSNPVYTAGLRRRTSCFRRAFGKSLRRCRTLPRSPGSPAASPAVAVPVRMDGRRTNARHRAAPTTPFSKARLGERNALPSELPAAVSWGDPRRHRPWESGPPGSQSSYSLCYNKSACPCIWCGTAAPGECGRHCRPPAR